MTGGKGCWVEDAGMKSRQTLSRACGCDKKKMRIHVFDAAIGSCIDSSIAPVVILNLA